MESVSIEIGSRYLGWHWRDLHEARMQTPLSWRCLRSHFTVNFTVPQCLSQGQQCRTVQTWLDQRVQSTPLSFHIEVVHQTVKCFFDFQDGLIFRKGPVEYVQTAAECDSHYRRCSTSLEVSNVDADGGRHLRGCGSTRSSSYCWCQCTTLSQK